MKLPFRMAAHTSINQIQSDKFTAIKIFLLYSYTNIELFNNDCSNLPFKTFNTLIALSGQK